jgi:hypothetical protein
MVKKNTIAQFALLRSHTVKMEEPIKETSMEGSIDQSLKKTTQDDSFQNIDRSPSGRLETKGQELIESTADEKKKSHLRNLVIFSEP